ncbi:protein-L-isoaspartate(D-aspartate) O-methyltransferase [Neomegalonema perideroedes]|uniref:protein-L-isoaspartate(D-aspartate) O-methyltransferase n=1 Tax=Neomegalonema perideroedes TaxID=217219 RepID=UPI00035C5694
MTAAPTPSPTRMRDALLDELVREGVLDAPARAAMEAVPREIFVDPLFAARAWEDSPLPIPGGQTISAPSVVALMTTALAPTRRCKILEVGAGSGYQTAVLARLARRVYAVERRADLARLAEDRFAALGIGNVSLRHADGALGWPEQAPFDRILVAAAAEDPPPALLSQLRIGGVMVLPVGQTSGMQELIKVEKSEFGYHYTELKLVRFVPLLGGVVRAEEADRL